MTEPKDSWETSRVGTPVPWMLTIDPQCTLCTPIRKPWGCAWCVFELEKGGGRQNSRYSFQGFSLRPPPWKESKATTVHNLHERAQVRDGSSPYWAWPWVPDYLLLLSAQPHKFPSLSPLALTPQSTPFFADAETSPCNQVLFWTVHLLWTEVTYSLSGEWGLRPPTCP